MKNTSFLMKTSRSILLAGMMFGVAGMGYAQGSAGGAAGGAAGGSAGGAAGGSAGGGTGW